MAKKTFGGRDVYIYIKNRLGYASAPRESVFVLICNALSKDDRPLPWGVEPRSWAFQNLQYIKKVSKTIKDDNSFVFNNTKKIIVAGHKSNVQIATEIKQKKKGKSEKISKNAIASDEFLYTYAWRKLRMEALKLYGARCQCCGASPATGAVMNVDHIKPRRLFPDLALNLKNLQVLCGECNHGKGNWDQTDWRCTK